MEDSREYLLGYLDGAAAAALERARRQAGWPPNEATEKHRRLLEKASEVQAS